ncbi:hypothetical protein M3231_00695 [Neobacillus mesonae]|nr:hypothetical protein [Neobacillus mesonae]
MNDYNPYKEPLDLDTFVKLIKIKYSIENWDEVISLSGKLLDLAKEAYKEMSEQDSTSHVFDKHIIFYFGYSYLMTGLSYQKLRNYEKSKEYISFYADLDWLNDSTETGQRIIQDFKFFAATNTLTVDILNGNRDRMDEYVEFLNNNPAQVLPGLVTILESAINHHYNVDSEIAILSSHIENYEEYKERIVAGYYLSYHYLLAIYKHKDEKINEAIDITLHILVAADRLHNDKYFKKAISLFEILRKDCTIDQLKVCYDILNDIIVRGGMLNEKDTSFSNSPVGTVDRNYIS